MNNGYFSYEDIIGSYNLAHADGLEPTQIHLGYDQTQELLKDTNFKTSHRIGSNSAGGGGKSIGVVAGIDVQQAQMPHLKVMTAQKGDELAYYVL